MKYSACIEMLFPELPFVERIYKAKEAGFDAVEFWLWNNKDIEAIKRALDETGLELGIFQGNMEGRMIDKNDIEAYVNGVRESMKTAKYLGAKNLFVMTDILQEDRTVLEPPYRIAEKDKVESIKTILNTLKADAEDKGITLVIEPLNVLVDHKGYYLDHSKPAFDMVREINSPNIKVLYDVYHMQIMEGNIIDTLRGNMDAIGYIHIADVPGRHEPGTGELNFSNIYKVFSELDYKGIVGFEFDPTHKTEDVVADVFKSIR